MNETVKDILTNDITELNSLLCAAVYVVTGRKGMMKEKIVRKNEEVFWKRRFKRSIENWRKDLSNIEEVRKGNSRLKQGEQDYMSRKYQLEGKGTWHVPEMLKQKIKAGGIKITRYEERCLQFQQNNLFITSQKLFYETLYKGKREERVTKSDKQFVQACMRLCCNLINHSLFLDDLKLYGANRDQLDSLIQTVRIFFGDIQMSFGLEKCAVLERKRGRRVDGTGIEFQMINRLGKWR